MYDERIEFVIYVQIEIIIICDVCIGLCNYIHSVDASDWYPRERERTGSSAFSLNRIYNFKWTLIDSIKSILNVGD